MYVCMCIWICIYVCAYIHTDIHLPITAITYLYKCTLEIYNGLEIKQLVEALMTMISTFKSWSQNAGTKMNT